MEGRQYLIRRLTPKESFRLMGVKDGDIEKIQQTGLSKSRQYVLVGNSIVVNLLSYVFHNMFINPTIVPSENSRGGVKMSYTFPKPIKLEKTLKDVLEPHVDESYYLTERTLKGFQKHNENHRKKGTGFIFRPKTENDIAGCLRANAALCPTDNTVIQPYKPIKDV